MTKSTKVILLVLFVLVLDQSLKIWVKLSFPLRYEQLLFGLEWARLRFEENPGMAFGWQLPDPYGKLLLSLFRIFAVSLLIYFIRQLIKSKAKTGLLLSFALILAGALGNIIDSAFYGMIFSGSYHGVATLFPESGGYASFLHGQVVDMLYFPMFEGYFPQWFPFWGGEYFRFFRPVFNIADAAITIGVLSIILFHRSFFSEVEEEAKQENVAQGLEEKIPDKEHQESSQSSSEEE